MQKSLIKLAAVFLFVITTNAFATDKEQKCDDDTLHIVAKHLGLDEMQIDFVSQACKTAPINKNVMLVALAIDVHAPSRPDLGGGKTYTEVVAKVNHTKQKVISIFKQEVGTDATTDFNESSLTLDTARYQLNVNTKAFGVRYVSSAIGASCADGYHSSQLTLYIDNGNKLLPILVRDMYVAEALKGCLGMATKDDLARSANLGLSILKTKTKGYSDLLLTATIEDERFVENSNFKQLKDSLRLVFDGNYYILEKKKCYPWWVSENGSNKPTECQHH